jgi:SPP1 gp7 family putative phage head morphogenesis protein
MIQGALDADGRIAAKNAVKIRAALRQVTDFKRVFEKYQETHPQPTENLAQDRARARSWVILNVYLNNEALDAAIKRSWAEAYVLGNTAAGEWIAKTREAQKADQSGIDWDNWQPGDKATALLLNPTGGFAKFLEQSGGASFFKKFDKETVENLGTALSNSIELGLDAEHAATMIAKHVASPARALTIAITEQNRAMSYGSIQRYKEADLERMEWHTSDPCDKCAQNGGAVVVIGQDFPSGQAQPPAHPHCRCVLLPVIPGMEEEPAIPGAVVTPMPTGAAHTGSAPKPAPIPTVATTGTNRGNITPGAWQRVDAPQLRQEYEDKIRERYKGNDAYINMLLKHPDKATKALIEKGIVYRNGNVEAQFFNGGASISEKTKKEFIEYLEKLQLSNGKDKLTVIVGTSKKGAYGWAIAGGEQIWVAPSTIKQGLPAALEYESGHKMPVLQTMKQWEYTLTHEWGHHIDVNDLQREKRAMQTLAINKIKTAYPDAFTSKYSGKNEKEFFAEMFAEWYGTGGKTENQLVQAMAKEFSWNI